MGLTAQERHDIIEADVESEFFAKVCQDPTKSLLHVVKATPPAYLGDDLHWFCEQLQRYMDRHGTVVMPFAFAKVLVGQHFEDKDERIRMLDVITRLYCVPCTFGDAAVYRFRNWLAWRIYGDGFLGTRDGYVKSREASMMLDHAQSFLDRARVVLTDSRETDVSNHYADRVVAWERERDNPGLRRALLFGIPQLDQQLRVRDGSVTSVLGVFKRYKSIFLNHVGVCALVQGFNVLHVTYENEIEQTLDRYYSRLSAIPYDDLVSLRVQESEPARFAQADNFIRGLDTHLTNRLIVVTATPKVTTVRDIEAQMAALEANRGFVPDVTIWDYANLIGIEQARRAKGDNGERLDQENIIWDLQAHAKDARGGGARRRIVVTAIQAKAEAIKAEHLDASHLGKSIGIPQALDSLIGINQTRQERSDGKLRLAVLFSRDSKVGDEVTVDCDISWMAIDTASWAFVHDRAVEMFMRRAV